MSAGGSRIAVHLRAPAERAVRAGHPWVYAEGIKQQRRSGRAGDLAVIFDRRDQFLAIGLYDPDSPIRVRILHQGDPERIDGAWFQARLRTALERRSALSASETTGFRMVHGENDGLPGLVVDRYGRSTVVKIYSCAWLTHLPHVLAGLDALVDSERVVLRLSRAVASLVEEADLGVHDGQILSGSALSGPVEFQENGLLFEADLVRGQKTGFFLDQRDNRARLESYAAGKSSVLNVFSYTGGFSLYAARGGARSVTSLDISAPALSAAERNFRRNRSDAAVAAARHQVICGDAFAVMTAMRERGERFEAVVIDPPSFADSKAHLEGALRAYARVARLGLDLLPERGLFVMSSCTSRITGDRFRALVTDTAAESGRAMRILEQTGHPPDHPIGFPEGAYLKCIFADVSG